MAMAALAAVAIRRGLPAALSGAHQSATVRRIGASGGRLIVSTIRPCRDARGISVARRSNLGRTSAAFHLAARRRPATASGAPRPARYLSDVAGSAGKSDAAEAAKKSAGAAGGSARGGAGGGEGGRRRWSRIRLLAKMIKYTRIPALILGVYGLGYQQGIIDYSRDPALKQDDLLTSILGGVGCVDRSKVKTARDGDWRTKFLGTNDAQMRRVALVGEKIIKVAKKYVDEELGKIMAERMSHLTDEDKADEDRLFRLLMRDEDCAFWAAAKQRMDGRWAYLLIDTDVANAFVSEILPQRIFVTTAMMDQFVENDDEMALVLGHEVSHLILGHVSDSNTLSTMLRTVEVLLLSLDPSEGILSLAFMSFLATARHSLQAANSRENETQADELGIKLAAMACYDTKRAAQVFYKMHLHGTESGAEDAAAKESGRSLLSFVDTHPPTDERHMYLVKASEEENAERYEDSHCGSIKKMFKDMLREVKRRESEKGTTNGAKADGKDAVALNGGGISVTASS